MQAKEMVMETTEQQYAFDMIARTRTSCFLTGKAGTGKTTFLKNVQAEIEKNFAVVAPDGRRCTECRRADHPFIFRNRSRGADF